MLDKHGYYYTNTLQGIFANIKDGIRILRNKYASTGSATAIDNISQTEMRFASAVYRYNQGSPYKAQFAYEAWSTASSSTDLLSYLKKSGYHNSTLNLMGANDTARTSWLQNVKDTCKNKTFKECLTLLTTNHIFQAPPLYLEIVGNKLKTNIFGTKYEDADLGDKFIKINTGSLIMALASPAKIQATDSQGRKSGLYGSSILEQIPNTWYDSKMESLTLLVPGSDNVYKVVGKSVGTYDYVVIMPTASDVLTFVALDIPTVTGAVHRYVFDWNALAQGRADAVTVVIDQNGDGKVDATIKSDRRLTANEFKEASEIGGTVTICHIPPGNPDNKHTISIGQSAVKAHLGHGDTLGDCDDDKKSDKKDDKPEKDSKDSKVEKSEDGNNHHNKEKKK